ncbi:Glycopeptide antibiotics resistance protein [Nocardioides exalbidus]|uniref:Glycopeptide antibiotics resistance protein n=1 Tax=Nocardioides exalbidus TaxID=402596 RepID=A0A1H4JS38_9ACTN|nr:VanZ family protein [Nocardioides exalbidus]SEB48957.1 Glycopeptide antibiotics resistance protein [Nocardioides exalbidus]
MFREVPVLPVVLPLGAAVCLLLVWRLHRRRIFTWPRAAVALALGVYAGGIVANTVFPIFLDKPARSAEWDTYLALTPIAGYGVADAVTNVVVLAPLGVLVSLVLARPTWWRVVAVAAAASLGIETTQYVTALTLGGGHVADVNDLLFNVVGGALGLAVLAVLARVPAVARLVDRFRWR